MWQLDTRGLGEGGTRVVAGRPKARGASMTLLGVVGYVRHRALGFWAWWLYCHRGEGGGLWRCGGRFQSFTRGAAEKPPRIVGLGE